MIEPLNGLCFTTEWDQPNRSGLGREDAAQFLEQAALIVLGTVKGIEKFDCTHASSGSLADARLFCKQSPLPARMR
jgi:hypothetical protein